MKNNDIALIGLMVLLIVSAFVLFQRIEPAQARSSIAQTPPDSLVSLLEEQLGAPYRSGGQTAVGFDCSGLVYYGLSSLYPCKIPRVSYRLPKSTKPIIKDSLQPGDLVFFDTNGGRDFINHVGVYRGNDSFIHSSTRKGVIISRLDSGFYENSFMKAGRFVCD
jgi:cell wall-associated NlpC family hydrolase